MLSQGGSAIRERPIEACSMCLKWVKNLHSCEFTPQIHECVNKATECVPPMKPALAASLYATYTLQPPACS